MFDGLSEAEAKEFAARWLPAWTGNHPERLAAFYADASPTSEMELGAE